MKQLFLNYSMESIKRNYPNYDDQTLEEIRYGLEGIYLSLTKLVVISILSIILNIFYEMLIMLICFNILRTTGFGLHAKKSIQCWISSTIMFIFLPLISKYFVISKVVHTSQFILSSVKRCLVISSECSWPSAKTNFSIPW